MMTTQCVAHLVLRRILEKGFKIQECCLFNSLICGGIDHGIGRLIAKYCGSLIVIQIELPVKLPSVD